MTIPHGGYIVGLTNGLPKLENLTCSFEFLLEAIPNLLGMVLDRKLSNHRHELKVDYCPMLFRVFHFWFLDEDFSKLVEDSWRSDG